MSLSTLPQSPTITAPPAPNLAVRRPDETLNVDLIVRHVPREALSAEKPFKILFTVTVSAPVTPTVLNQLRKQRVITLVIQHVQPPKPVNTASVAPSINAAMAETWSPRLPSSGFSTPSPYATPHRGDFPDTLAQKLMYASPRQVTSDLVPDADTSADGGDATPAPPTREERISVVLPPPFAVTDPSAPAAPSGVRQLGPSATFLPQLRLLAPQLGGADDAAGHEPGHERTFSESTVASSEMDSDLHETLVSRVPRVLASQDFHLEFLPRKTGFATVGGLRALVAEDRMVEGEDVAGDKPVWLAEARTLKEWDVVAEIWVNSVSTQ